MNKKTIYYVVGGMFARKGMPEKEFMLSHPSGTKLPYITDDAENRVIKIGNERLAMYQVDLESQILRKIPDAKLETNGTQPSIITLSNEMLRNIHQAIKTKVTFIQ